MSAVPPGPDGPIEYILWAGTVGFTSPLDERFAAAAEAGCQRVSLSPNDVLRAAQYGTSAGKIARQAADYGLGLIIDPVMNWYPDSHPSPSRFAGVSADDALKICEDLGVVSLTVIATATSDVPLPELAGHFAAVCDRAAGFGAQVHLEFIPFTLVRNLRIAWEIAATADRDNGGLLFDTWHFYRGEPEFEVLAGIPGDKIFCVQLDDAAAVPQGSLREETKRRLLPGDGAFDLTAAIRALHRIGGLRWVGPEVISPDVEALGVLGAAGVAVRRTREVIGAALAQA